MKIGITERGDPSIDFAWVEKLDKVDAAIIITKNLTDKVIDAAKPYYNKLVFHISCTGFGGTVIEPNIPKYTKQLSQAYKLAKSGVSMNRIVIRIDPIVATQRGLHTADKVLSTAYKMGFRRFRISLIDMYPHVRERMKAAGVTPPYGEKGFYPPSAFVERANAQIREWKDKYPDIKIESCAEGTLTEAEQLGCISKRDIEILGLDEDEVREGGYQRKGCLCCSAKTELLTEKHQCPYKCMYCYWQNE